MSSYDASKHRACRPSPIKPHDLRTQSDQVSHKGLQLFMRLPKIHRPLWTAATPLLLHLLLPPLAQGVTLAGEHHVTGPQGLACTNVIGTIAGVDYRACPGQLECADLGTLAPAEGGQVCQQLSNVL